MKKLILAAALSLGALTSQAQLLTSVQNAFVDPGWSLLWNPNGALGDPSTYQALTSVGTPTAPFYSAVPTDPEYLFANYQSQSPYAGVIGGLPGPGYNMGSGGIFSVIFGYTLISSAVIELQNSLLANIYNSDDGIKIWVFVNNETTARKEAASSFGQGSTASFNVNLGPLQAGDTFYVAVSPQGNNFADVFALQYDVVAVPEPSTYGLLLVAGCLILRRRRATMSKV